MWPSDVTYEYCIYGVRGSLRATPPFVDYSILLIHCSRLLMPFIASSVSAGSGAEEAAHYTGCLDFPKKVRPDKSKTYLGLVFGSRFDLLKQIVLIGSRYQETLHGLRNPWVCGGNLISTTQSRTWGRGWGLGSESQLDPGWLIGCGESHLEQCCNGMQRRSGMRLVPHIVPVQSTDVESHPTCPQWQPGSRMEL